METSIFIARLIAVIYLAVAAGMLLNPGFYGRLYKDVANSPTTIYFGGVLALLVGFLIVTYHNRWDGGWPILITIIGWLAVIKGICLLAAPEMMIKMTSSIGPRAIRFGWIFTLVMGLLFVWFGFIKN